MMRLMSGFRGWSVLLLGLAMVAGRAEAGSLTILQTTQSGAQSQLDVNHSYFWAFEYTGSATFSPIVASFVMKRGPKTDKAEAVDGNQGPATAVMSMWAADPVTGLNTGLLYQVIMPASAFTQSFNAVNFTLYSGAAATLPPRFNITLTSDAKDTQAHAFFIKGLFRSDFLFQGDGGTPLPDFYYDGVGPGSNGG
ncbi:MAG: hypothetical protein ACKOJF_28100, partial [Planctomycetaceae bacterium]